MSEFKLVMISAMFENGGNTLHRFLDGHPNLFVYPFESQVGTGAGTDFLSSLVPARYRWPEFPEGVSALEAYEMLWDEELKTLLRVPNRSKFKECGLEMYEKERREWFISFFTHKTMSRAGLVEAYFRSAFESWKNYNRSGEETTFVGYNPVQVLDTEKIFNDFPKAHIVHIVRNPYSGYSDTRKRPFPWPLDRYVWTWNLCQHMALAFREKFAGRFHLVRYEDLTADVEDTMRGLLEAIGLPFSENCLHPSFNRKKLERVRPWGTITAPTHVWNVETAKELGADDRQRIKVEAGVMMDLLGYGSFFEDFLL